MGKLKKQSHWFLLLLLFSPIQVQALSPEETVLQLLKDYSPTGYYIVSRYLNAPTEVNFNDGTAKYSFKSNKNKITEFLEGNTEKEIRMSIGTLVHEFCHGYTSSLLRYQLLEERQIPLVLGNNCQTYYIGGNANIIIKKAQTFPTREIASSISESLRTFRFKLYVDSESPYLGTQIDGIYGLLNEFNAYYHGIKASVDLYPYYRDNLGPDPEKWVDYFIDVNGQYFAYQEFKFFILKYLQYAETNHVEIYRNIINNQKFCKAFLAIDQNFATLIRDYFQIKEEIFKSLRTEGYTITQDAKFDNIRRRQPYFYRGISHQLSSCNLLQNELAKAEYQTIIKVLGDNI